MRNTNVGFQSLAIALKTKVAKTNLKMEIQIIDERREWKKI